MHPALQMYKTCKRVEMHDVLRPSQNVIVRLNWSLSTYIYTHTHTQLKRRIALCCMLKATRCKKVYDDITFSVAGEEVVTVPCTSSSQDNWKVQRLPVNKESPQSSNRRRGCNRPQLQPISSSGKRNRPAPPPPPPQQPIFRRTNTKDQVDRYFDWPNKENTPENAVNHHEDDQTNQVQTTEETMGSNLSRHNGKGLTGRRTQSSGNLCDSKGKLNTMGKILVPCSSAQKERLITQLIIPSIYYKKTFYMYLSTFSESLNFLLKFSFFFVGRK